MEKLGYADISCRLSLYCINVCRFIKLHIFISFMLINTS